MGTGKSKSLYSPRTIREIKVVLKIFLQRKTPCQMVAQANFSNFSKQRSFQFYATFPDDRKRKELIPY